MSYPTRTETLDDLYTAVYNNRKKTVTDQIFTATPVYRRLTAAKAIQLDGTGGRYIEVPLSYAKNETVTSLDKGDTISISDTKFLTVAQFEWKFVGGSVVRYYTDDAKNKSKQAHLKLANAKVENLRRSMIDKFENFLFGDGTGNGSKDPNGFGNLVDNTPATGTVGNINSATYSWWRNKSTAATGAASVYMLSDMRTMYNDVSKGQAMDVPNLIVTDQTSQELFEEEVEEQKQIVNKNTGDPMMVDPVFKGVPVVWSSECTAGYMYFLNTQYIGLNVDPDINMTMTEWKPIPNQLDRVAQIVWKGNSISSRRASLGVLTGIAA